MQPERQISDAHVIDEFFMCTSSFENRSLKDIDLILCQPLCHLFDCFIESMESRGCSAQCGIVIKVLDWQVEVFKRDNHPPVPCITN